MIYKLHKTIVSFFLLAFTVLLIISFNSCEKDFIIPPDNNVGFPPEIENLFNAPLNQTGITCATSSCHGTQNPASGLNLVEWSKTMEGSSNGSMVIPYNSFFSHMTSVVNNDTNVAPVAHVSLSELHKLSPDKVVTIRSWIDDGAKSKNGDIAFTTIENSGFITNQASDLIAVIETKKKLVTRLIPVGGRTTQLDAPHYISSDPQKEFLYVSLIAEGYLEKFNSATYEKVGRIPAGSSPAHTVISPDGMTGYLTNFDVSGNERMTRKFTTSPFAIVSSANDVKMWGNHGMALSSNGEMLYVASQIGEYLFKIFASDMSILESAPLDPSVPPTGQGTGAFKPYQISISPDDSLLFVSCTASNQVRVYRASDLAMINSIPVGANPLLMNFTPDGNYLFVCNRNSNSVTVINRATQTVHTTINNVGIQPHGVDFTSDGTLAYIACETQSGPDGHHPVFGSVKPGVSRVINVTNMSLLDIRMEMGSFPAGIVILR
jgi:YVTN family beta-propeller protein